MRIKSFESAELLSLTVLGTVMCVVGYYRRHPRLEFLVGVTVAMGVMAFIARFRQRRQIKTLSTPAKRRRRGDQ